MKSFFISINQWLNRNVWFATLFATFAGVLLAFYLNRMNAMSRENQRIESSIRGIQMEMTENMESLADSKGEDSVYRCLMTIDSLGYGIRDAMIITSERKNQLMREFSEIIKIEDSIVITDDSFGYIPKYSFGMSISGYQDVAWKVAQIDATINSFDFDLLKTLFSIYSIQDTYVLTKRDIFNSLSIGDDKKLRASVRTMVQLKPQLLKLYEEGLMELEKN